MIYTLYINNSTNFTLRIVRFTCTSSVMNFIIEKLMLLKLLQTKGIFRIISLVLYPVIYPRPKGYWSEDVSFLKIIWNGYVIFFIMYM